MIETYYQKRAEEIVDNLFNKGYFDRDVKREDMRSIEELLAYYFQSSAEGAVRADRLLRTVRDTKEGNTE